MELGFENGGSWDQCLLKKQAVWSGVTPCDVTNFCIGRDFLELEHHSMQVNGGICIVVIASFSSGHCIIHALDPTKLAEELNYLPGKPDSPRLASVCLASA